MPASQLTHGARAGGQCFLSHRRLRLHLRLRSDCARHSCDTLLQALGVPPRVVMDILGHTTLAMTMERYAKALPEAKADAARRMDMLMSGRKSDIK